MTRVTPAMSVARPAPEPVVCLAHLDTVFHADEPLVVRRDGTRIYCPGIGDNGRGLAAMSVMPLVLSVRTYSPGALVRLARFVRVRVAPLPVTEAKESETGVPSRVRVKLEDATPRTGSLKVTSIEDRGPVLGEDTVASVAVGCC